MKSKAGALGYAMDSDRRGVPLLLLSIPILPPPTWRTTPPMPPLDTGACIRNNGG